MSDDLVKRLREDQPVTQDMGSTAQCDLQDAAADRIEELEAKLEKAVEALEQIASYRKKCHEYDDDVGHERREFDVEDMIIMEYAARTTLAELKGEK
jgi:hypothetical protein